MSTPMRRIAALVALCVLASCAGARDAGLARQSWPDSECRRLGEDFQIDPVLSVDAALKIFRNQILPGARDSGRSFPGYSRWLDEVTTAIRRHEVSEASVASAEAQPEFSSWVGRIDMPRRDVETGAAFQQQTEFTKIARNLTKRMRCQTDERRAAASAHLLSDYALPR